MRWVVIVAVWTPLLGAPRLSAQEPIPLGGIADSQIGEAIPEGWTLRPVGGQNPPTTAVEWIDDQPAVAMRADSAAGQVWLELDRALEPEDLELSWEWRVSGHLPGAALREMERDDSPARFFVVFGGGGLFGRPRVLFYSWGGGEMRGDAFLSHVSDRLGVIVIRNSADRLSTWIEERRNLSEDFRRVFDRDPDEIRAIGVMSDTDQLGGESEAYFRSIRVTPGARTPEPSEQAGHLGAATRPEG